MTPVIIMTHVRGGRASRALVASSSHLCQVAVVATTMWITPLVVDGVVVVVVVVVFTFICIL